MANVSGEILYNLVTDQNDSIQVVDNTTTESTDNLYPFDLVDVDKIVRKVNYGIGSTGVILNVITLLAIIKNDGPLKLQLKLLASLAVSDILVAAISALHYDLCPNTVWVKIDTNCIIEAIQSLSKPSRVRLIVLILGDVYTSAQFSGLFTMFAICIDLLHAVCSPVRHFQQRANIGGNVLIIIIWFVPLLVIMTRNGILFYWNPDATSWLNPLSIISPDDPSEVFMMLTVLSFIPFLVMYTAIVCKIRHHARRTPSSQIRKIGKAVCTMLLITLTYMICMMTLLWILIFGILIKDPLPFPYLSIFQSVYLCNTVFDAIIYAVRVPEIRSEIRKMLKLCCLGAATRRRSTSSSYCTTV